MKMKLLVLLLGAVSCTAVSSCGDQKDSSTEKLTTDSSTTVKIKEETVSYTVDGKTMKGFLAYDENRKGKMPAIVIVHEWWGLNDYIRKRARQLADMGYVAFAADMYGEGKIAGNPKEAQEMATPYYTNPQLTRTVLDGAILQVKGYAQTDTARVAAIGYCFGGFVVLNASKLGADLKGAVSFHGNLAGVPPRKDLLKAAILVCHGEADKFVSQQEVDHFKHSMDSIGADYSFKSYPGATHAFTNPDATEIGKKFNMPIEYNPKADTASWNDMKTFFGKIF